jgi:tetratricopeptide (TPR) repeat protein
MVKRIAAFSFVFLLLVLGARPASAQFAQLAGKLVGEDGQPLANTVISIDREDMRGHYEVKTQKDGTFRHAGLPLGVYSVSVMDGDKKVFTQSKIRTSLNNPVSLEINLREERARTEAAAAGVDLGGQKLTEEQMKAIEEQKTARDEAIQKRQELLAKYGSAEEALKNKDYDTAITGYQAAAEVDPTQHVVFAKLGESYGGKAQATRDAAQKKELFTKAEESYRKALELKPDDASYHNNFALALVSSGKVQEAQDELKKAAQLDATNAGQYYFNLGAVLVNTGNMQPAADAFKQSTETTPPFAEGYYQLGVTLIGMATVDPKTGAMIPPPGTKEALEKYLEVAPSGPNADAAKGLVETLSSTVATTVGGTAPAKK